MKELLFCLLLTDTIPEKIQPVVDRFVYEASVRGYELPARLPIKIVYASISSPGYWVEKERTIYVSKRFSDDLEMIVFHELGHAWLGLNHSSGLMAERPKDYKKNRAKYLDDLFR